MAIYTAAGFETQQDSRFADNSSGDIDEADYRDAFEDIADSCAFTADSNTFSEDNIFGEIDHTQVFGATSISAYDNTSEVSPTMHVYCDDDYAIAIENTDNSDADTKRFVFGQKDSGELVLNRVSESGGTDTENEVYTFDQNDNGVFSGNITLCEGKTGIGELTLADETIADDEYRHLRILGTHNSSLTVAGLGVRTHSGITNACAYLFLEQENGTGAYMWNDNSANFRTSPTSTHVGTTSGTVVGTQTSDKYYKEKIKDSSYGLDEILKLKARNYTRGGQKEEGFIAQETMEVIPEAVYETDILIDEGRSSLAMDYVRIMPALVNAIKELNEKIESK